MIMALYHLWTHFANVESHRYLIAVPLIVDPLIALPLATNQVLLPPLNVRVTVILPHLETGSIRC